MNVNVKLPTLNLLDYEAAFIDIDGTAVDSEPVIRRIIEDMAREAGFHLEPDCWKVLGGLGDKGVWKQLHAWRSDFNLTYNTAEFFEEVRLSRYFDCIANTKPHQPVLEFTHMFIEEGRDVGAVTNSPPRIAEPHLCNAGYPRDKMFLLTEIDAHSRNLPSKPHPALYNMAFHQVGLKRLDRGVQKPFEKASCLVLEDSPNGARAGLRAGHTTIHFTDLANPLAREEVDDLTYSNGSIYHPMPMAEFDRLVKSARALKRVPVPA